MRRNYTWETFSHRVTSFCSTLKLCSIPCQLDDCKPNCKRAHQRLSRCIFGPLMSGYESLAIKTESKPFHERVNRAKASKRNSRVYIDSKLMSYNLKIEKSSIDFHLHCWDCVKTYRRHKSIAWISTQNEIAFLFARNWNFICFSTIDFPSRELNACGHWLDVFA